MKKNVCFFICFLLFISLATICYSAEKISCDLEGENAVSYYTRDVNSSFDSRYHKWFIKLVDKNAPPEYWIRLSSNNTDRFLYYLTLEFNNQSFKLFEIENRNIHHIQTTTGLITEGAFNIYAVPYEVIEKLKSISTPITLIINKSNRQGIKLNSNLDFTQAIQKIISLEYDDKEQYWKSNIKE